MNKDKKTQICRVMAENIALRTKTKILERENEKLKNLLKAIKKDFNFIDIHFECASGNGHCDICPFNESGQQGDCSAVWKRVNEINEVLNNESKK